MAFIITYRDPRVPGFTGLSVLPDEAQVRATLERLRHEGYEVTSTEPRPVRVPSAARV